MNTSCNDCEDLSRLQNVCGGLEDQLAASHGAATHYFNQVVDLRQAMNTALSMHSNEDIEDKYAWGVLRDALEVRP